MVRLEDSLEQETGDFWTKFVACDVAKRCYKPLAMSNSNGHATAISDETNSPEQSLEIPKVMNERTISDAVMEDDSEQTTEIPVQDPASAANPDLIAIANTDVLTVPWLELKATAKDRLLEVLYQSAKKSKHPLIAYGTTL